MVFIDELFFLEQSDLSDCGFVGCIYLYWIHYYFNKMLLNDLDYFESADSVLIVV